MKKLVVIICMVLLTGCYSPPADVDFDIEGALPQAQTSPLPSVSTSPSPAVAKAYILSVLENNDRVWSAFFEDKGLTRPFVSYLIVEGQDTFTSSCAFRGPDGIPVEVTVHTNFNNALYCASDGNGQGLLIFPLGTFVRLFSGDIFGREQRVIGDFAAAAVVSHEFGHHVMDEFMRQLNLSPTRAVDGELLADCFFGTWAHVAELSGDLHTGDIDEGVEFIKILGNGDHGSMDQRVEAFMVGYNDGVPLDCTQKYWN